MTNEIAIVVGTRPEIIKMSPIIMELEKNNYSFFLIHAGQHYSYFMKDQIFNDLGIREPEYVFNFRNKDAVTIFSSIIRKSYDILRVRKPSTVLVQGDTNTVLAASLAAIKYGIPVSHVEAGLRSNNFLMQEEINRILTDHMSTLLFSPTNVSYNNLVRENVRGKIFIVGNTIVDVTIKYSSFIKQRPVDTDYILFTLHRAENVDNKNTLNEIINAVEEISIKTGLKVIFPAHPRTLKNLKRFKIIKKIHNIDIVKPMGYLEFLKYEKHASLIITDSGGVQEEACILKVPCVTVRNETERPETVEVGSNIVAGTKKENIIESVFYMINKERNWDNPFGDGNTSKKIIKVLKNEGYI